MSDTGMAPRDHTVEAARRSTARRRRIAIGVIIALVAGLGVAQLAFGWVNRVIDATGWTCGTGWERIDDDELAAMRIITWGTPQVREQGVEPEQFTDLPPGLDQPSLTTPSPATDGYKPRLYPLGEGVVMQADGYWGSSWVGADARTGEPLWGIEHDADGMSTLQGRVTMILARDDGRTDVTTFHPRTGEELSCVRLEGSIVDMTSVGESDIVVALRSEGDRDSEGVDSTTSVVRVDPVTGDVVWNQPLASDAISLASDGQVVTVSARGAGAVATRWMDQTESTVVALDAADGHELGQLQPEQGQWAAVDAVAMPDGTSAALLYGFIDEEAWSDGEATYLLVDADGVEHWRVATPREQEELGAWVADGVLVVFDGWGIAGLDLLSGERLWQPEEVSALLDDVALMDVDGQQRLLITDQGVREEGGDWVFSTVLLDPRTGEVERYRAALRSARITDSYLLTDSGLTQMVIPLAAAG